MTVWIGLGKLLYNKRQLRYYAARAILEASARGTNVNAPYSDDVEADTRIPFGIRAIQRGIEVEGVWVSRSNSPASSRPSSLASSKARHHLPSTTSQTSLYPTTVRDRSPFGPSSSSSIRSSTIIHEHSRAAERISSATSLLGSEQSTPRRSMSSNHDRLRGRSLPRDLSFLDLAQINNYRPQPSPRLSTIIGTAYPTSKITTSSAKLTLLLDDPTADVTSPRPRMLEKEDIELTDTNSKHMTQHSVDTISSLYDSTYTPELLSAETTPKTKTSFTSVETGDSEFSALEQHRLHQVASTGQLKRRLRRLSTEQRDKDNSPPPEVPQIRLVEVIDDHEEHDLGLLRTESDTFSFVEGRLDEIDTRDFAFNPDNQSPTQLTKSRRFSRPDFFRARTEPPSGQTRLGSLFRSITHQMPVTNTSTPDLEHGAGGDIHDLAPDSSPAKATSTPDLRLREKQRRHSGSSASGRIPRKLRKQKRVGSAGSSLRQSFLAAVHGRGEEV